MATANILDMTDKDATATSRRLSIPRWPRSNGVRQGIDHETRSATTPWPKSRRPRPARWVSTSHLVSAGCRRAV